MTVAVETPTVRGADGQGDGSGSVDGGFVSAMTRMVEKDKKRKKR